MDPFNEISPGPEDERDDWKIGETALHPSVARKWDLHLTQWQ